MPELRRLLVVDDEPHLRAALRAALDDSLLAVDEAADGTEAIARCDRTEYDVVLLDLRLPGRGGLAVLAHLRERCPATRVVVVTADATVDAAVGALRLGASDYLQKPFDPAQVREVVAKALRPVTDESYGALIAAARVRARERRLESAAEFARRAAAAAPMRPEAQHLLGVVRDLRGERLQAQCHYRAALALDPTYRPSERNLARSVDADPSMPLLVGDEADSGRR